MKFAWFPAGTFNYPISSFERRVINTNVKSLSFDEYSPLRTKLSKISSSKYTLSHKSIHILNSALSLTDSEGAASYIFNLPNS